MRVAEGEEEAFTILFNQYWDNIYSVAFLLTKSEAMAEDVVQDIFLKIWHKRTELTGLERLDNYLFVLARNHIFSEFKKLRIRKEHVERLKAYFNNREDTPEDRLLQKEANVLLARAVSGLAVQQQQVYRLSREQGFSYEEIAAKLGISVHTVRNHMSRALRHIREALQRGGNAGVVALFLLDAFL